MDAATDVTGGKLKTRVARCQRGPGVTEVSFRAPSPNKLPFDSSAPYSSPKTYKEPSSLTAQQWKAPAVNDASFMPSSSETTRRSLGLASVFRRCPSENRPAHETLDDVPEVRCTAMNSRPTATFRVRSPSPKATSRGTLTK